MKLDELSAQTTLCRHQIGTAGAAFFRIEPRLRKKSKCLLPTERISEMKSRRVDISDERLLAAKTEISEISEAETAPQGIETLRWDCGALQRDSR